MVDINPYRSHKMIRREARAHRPHVRFKANEMKKLFVHVYQYVESAPEEFGLAL